MNLAESVVLETDVSLTVVRSDAGAGIRHWMAWDAFSAWCVMERLHTLLVPKVGLEPTHYL